MEEYQRTMSSADNKSDERQEAPSDIHTARRGLIKAIWESSFAPRFSSKPIHMESYFSRAKSFLQDGGGSSVASDGLTSPSKDDFRQVLDRSSNLTRSEREYLENLLQSEDLNSIRQASVRLADKDIFPPAKEDDEDEDDKLSIASPPIINQRDSDIQQQLFRLHQETTMKPSEMLRRMSFSEQQRRARHFAGEGSSSDINSRIEENSIVAGRTRTSQSSWAIGDDEEDESTIQTKPPPVSPRKWNPFKDVNSWIGAKKRFRSHGDENDEMDEDDDPDSPFLILGISTNDTSCHPHVLSPPLMEGLQAFMAESLQENNFWLKYSLVRDGPGLPKLLRQCRASKHTILAIETLDGHVFGSFTSEPWRSRDSSFYGHVDSFVWRMRRSRNENCQSIVEKAMMESKIEVFPFTYRNQKVQACNEEYLALGEGQLQDMDDLDGAHFGNAIRLDKSLSTGSTSTSETFGSPCLIDPDQMGMEFQVANVEVWTMTSCTTVAGAERTEMKSLFMNEDQQGDGNKKLNLIDIIVGPSRT